MRQSAGKLDFDNNWRRQRYLRWWMFVAWRQKAEQRRSTIYNLNNHNYSKFNAVSYRLVCRLQAASRLCSAMLADQIPSHAAQASVQHRTCPKSTTIERVQRQDSQEVPPLKMVKAYLFSTHNQFQKIERSSRKIDSAVAHLWNFATPGNVEEPSGLGDS